MAKKSQTTGTPKPRPKVVEPVQPSRNPLTRQYRSRAEREQAVQQWVIRGVLAAVAITVIVIAAAFIIDRVIIPGQTVATVNGENITVAQFEQRVRLERALNIERVNQLLNNFVDLGGDLNQAGQLLQQDPYRTWWDELNLPDQMGLRVLNDMIDDRIVEDKAQEMGITVSDADIDAQIEQFFGYDAETVAAMDQEPTATPVPSETPTPVVSPTPSPEPTSTPTPETEPTATLTPFPTVPPTATLSATEIAGLFESSLTEFYRNIRRDAGLGETEVREYFRTLALRQAVADALSPELTTLSPYVNARHILVDTEEEALDIKAALEAGASFADLARAASNDTGSGAVGGELGWSPVLQFVTPFADAVRDAEIGALIGPVETDFGFHLIEVRGREEREISESQLDSFRMREFNTWLDEIRNSEEVTSEIYPVWANYVPEDPVFVYRPRS